MPFEVLYRSTKGDFTRLHYRGLRRNASVLEELFTGSRLSDIGLINDNEVRMELRRGVAGLPIRLAAFDFVVGTELWLRGVMERRG